MDNKQKIIIVIIFIFIGLIIGWLSTTGTKSQFIRLLDVFVFFPILAYAGYLLYDTNEILAIILIIVGAATAAYNFKNWLEYKKFNN